jgi:hypothetical protein
MLKHLGRLCVLRSTTMKVLIVVVQKMHLNAEIFDSSFYKKRMGL